MSNKISLLFLLSASFLFGSSEAVHCRQMFSQGYPVKDGQLMGIYNAPSRIAIEKWWDFYAGASFTYWQAMQDNLELGIVSDSLDNANTILNGNVVNMNFGYAPGFKLALGINFDRDGWDSRAQYTWFHNSHSTATSLLSTGTAVIAPFWGQPAVNNGDTYLNGRETWRIHMDLLDFEIGRNSFVGKDLCFRSFFGTRGAWIRQRVDLFYNTSSTANLDVAQVSNSWAVGPRLGLNMDWDLGKDFRFYGLSAGDLLFTEYTSLKDNESSFSQGVITTSNARQKNLFALRTHLELEFGFGWGSYFDNDSMHIDLMAGYCYQVFFNQNMFRHFEDDINIGTSTSPHGNLYVQGLTASIRFDF